MYRIGEFSNITGIPIRTLRFYEEKGLLKPTLVDMYTGYRYYDERKLSEIRWVLSLKSCGFTLDEIATYKDSLNRDIIDRKIDETKESIISLNNRLNDLNNMKDELERGVVRTLTPDRKTA